MWDATGRQHCALTLAWRQNCIRDIRLIGQSSRNNANMNFLWGQPELQSWSCVSYLSWTSFSPGIQSLVSDSIHIKWYTTRPILVNVLYDIPQKSWHSKRFPSSPLVKFHLYNYSLIRLNIKPSLSCTLITKPATHSPLCKTILSL